MRYIPLLETAGPIKNGQIDQAWLDAAEAITTNLKGATTKDQRAAILDTKANEIWGQLKQWLLSLSNDKCWFSEAADHFSNRDVEHFRPKKGCKRKVGQPKATYEEGYWWLAYDWKNYRICGNVGNSKKGIFFPLLNASPVSSYGGVSYSNECPKLLDPASPSDPALLDFIETGKAVPHSDANPIDRDRVLTTVKHIKLDFENLEEARAKIWIKCRDLIEECRKLSLTTPFSTAEKTKIEDMQNELRKMIKADALFSMTAAACLRKSGIGWATAIAAGA